MTESKIECPTILEDRVPYLLINLCETATKLVQRVFLPSFKWKKEADGLPNAVQLWLAFFAVRIYNTAESTLCLVAHNQGRDSITLQRQLFEYVKKAEFYADNPEIARLERDCRPFRSLMLMQRFGFSRDNLAAFAKVAARCNEIKAKQPDVYNYFEKHKKEPRDFRSMMGPHDDEELDEQYTWQYHYQGHTVHATVLNHEQVFKSGNIVFDSRQEDPCATVVGVTNYVLAFLVVLEKHLGFDIGKQIGELWVRLQPYLANYGAGA